MAKGKRCCDAVMWIKEVEDRPQKGGSPRGKMVTYFCRTCSLEMQQFEIAL